MIYFVHCERTGLTKIGKAETEAHAADRLRSFQCSSATRLRIVSLIDGDYAAERALHRKHRERRVHGEWFREIDAPPTQYDLAQFRTDIGARKAPALIEPGLGVAACACGAKIRSNHRRCRACNVAAGTDMASVRARAAARPESADAAAKRAAHEANMKRRAEYAAAAAAAGLPISTIRGRVHNGRNLSEALYPRGNRGRKNVTDHACRAANRCAPSLGMSAQHIYLVLRGKKNHERADEIRAAAKAAGWRAP